MKRNFSRLLAFVLVLSFVFNFTVPSAFAQESGRAADGLEEETNIHDIAEYKFLPGMETEEGAAVSGNAILEVGAGRSEMDGTGGVVVDMKLDGTKADTNKRIELQFGNSWVWLSGTTVHLQGDGGTPVEETVDWDLAQWHTYRITRQRKSNADGSYAGYQINFYVDDALKADAFFTGAMKGDNSWVSTLSLFAFNSGDAIRSASFRGDAARIIEEEGNIHDILEYTFLSGVETETGAAVSGNPILEVGADRSEMEGTGGFTVDMKLAGTKNRAKNLSNPDQSAMNMQFANSFIWLDNTTLHLPGASDMSVDWELSEWHTYQITRQRGTYPDGSYAGYQIDFYVDGVLKSSGFSKDEMKGGNSWTSRLSVYNLTDGDAIRTAGTFEEEGNIHDIAEYQVIPGMEREEGAAVTGNAILEVGAGRSEMEGTGGFLIDMKLAGTKNAGSEVQVQLANSWLGFNSTKLHLPGVSDVPVDWDIAEWHTYRITRQKEMSADGNYIGYRILFYVDDEWKASGFSNAAMKVQNKGNNWNSALSVYNFTDGDAIRSTGTFEKENNIHDIVEYTFLPGMERETGAAVTDNAILEAGAGRSEMEGTGGFTVDMKLAGTKNRTKNPSAPDRSAVNLQLANSWIWFDDTTLHLPGAKDVSVDWDLAEWHTYQITRQKETNAEGGYIGYKLSFYVDGVCRSSELVNQQMKGENSWTSTLSLYNFAEGDVIRSPKLLATEAEKDPHIRDISEFAFLTGMEGEDGLDMRSSGVEILNGMYGLFGKGEKEDFDITGGIELDMKLGGTKNRRKDEAAPQNSAVNVQLASSFIWFDDTTFHLPGANEVKVDWDLAEWHTYQLTRQRVLDPDGSYAGYQIDFYVDGKRKASGFSMDAMTGGEDWLSALSLYNFVEGDYIRSPRLIAAEIEKNPQIRDISDFEFIAGMESIHGLNMHSSLVGTLNGMYGIFSKGEKADFEVTGGVEVDMKLGGIRNQKKDEEAPQNSAVNIQLANSWVWFHNETLHLPGAADVPVDWDIAEWHAYKIIRQRVLYPDGSYAGYRISFYVDGEQKASGFSQDAMTGEDDWLSMLSLYNFAEGDYIRSPKYVMTKADEEVNVRDISDFAFFSGMEREDGLHVYSPAVGILNEMYGIFGKGEKADFEATGGVEVDMKLGGTGGLKKDEDAPQNSAVNIQLANSWIWFDSETLHLPGAADVKVDWDLAEWHSYKIIRQRVLHPDGSYAGYRIGFYVDGEQKASGFSQDPMTGEDDWLSTLSLYNFAEGDYIRSPKYLTARFEEEANVHDIFEYYYFLGLESEDGVNMRGRGMGELNGFYGVFDMGTEADLNGTGGFILDMKLGSLAGRTENTDHVSIQFANGYLWLNSQWLHLPGMIEDVPVDWDCTKWHTYKITRQKGFLPNNPYIGYRISFYVDDVLKASSFTREPLYGNDSWLQRLHVYEFGEGDHIRSAWNRGWLEPEKNVKDISDYFEEETLLTTGYEAKGIPVVNTGACGDTHATGGVIFQVNFTGWGDDDDIMWNQIGSLSVGIWNKGWVNMCINPDAFGEKIESFGQIPVEFDATGSKNCTIKLIRRQSKDKTGFVAALYIDNMNEPVFSHYFRNVPMAKADGWFDSVYIPAPASGMSTFRSARYYGVKTVVNKGATLNKVAIGESFVLPFVSMAEEDGAFVSALWKNEKDNLFANGRGISSYGEYTAMGVKMWNTEKAEWYQDDTGNHLKWTTYVDTDSKVALEKQIEDHPVSYGVEITRLSDQKTATYEISQVNSNGVEEWFHFDMAVDRSDEDAMFAYRSYVQVGEEKLYTGYAFDRDNTVSVASITGMDEIPVTEPVSTPQSPVNMDPGKPEQEAEEPKPEESPFNFVLVVIAGGAALIAAAAGSLLVTLKKRGWKKDV